MKLLPVFSLLPLCLLPLQAQLYWDTNAGTPGSGNAGGTWDAGTNWTTDSTGNSATVGWTDGNAAIFSAGTDGTGSLTFTIAGTVDPNSITFAQDGSKTISGGNITCGGWFVDFLGGSQATATISTSTPKLDGIRHAGPWPPTATPPIQAEAWGGNLTLGNTGQ
jgi:hypothetical protein